MKHSKTELTRTFGELLMQMTAKQKARLRKYMEQLVTGQRTFEQIMAEIEGRT